MNLENILNNNQNKLFFLKAILLGINYGKSKNYEEYITIIEKEIKKINEKKELKNMDKIENRLILLDNQKKYIISLIKQLGSQNYRFNYSKINLLRNNLIILEKEIEKNKLILKKNEDENLPKENLVGELEKTLGSLSNMLI
jgi:hypothetical protein